ncbi:MAG: hypothetical protein WD904_00570 [Dehalococcoidia bacterium]
MKKWILPGGVAIALFLAVAGGAFAFGAFDDDDSPTSADSVRESDCSLVHNLEACDDTGDGTGGDAARCAEGAQNCDDTGGDDISGTCIAEDDPAYDPEQPCNDTPTSDGGDGGGSMNMCVEGVTDCNDMVVQPSEGECGPDNTGACESLATEVAFADLETRVPGVEITVVSVEYTEWPDSSLGNPEPDMAYLQVITPGFKIVLAAGGQQYEYHTDLAGNFSAVN